MFILTTCRRFILAFAFAFFAMQSAALAHSYSYGDEPHEHNGQVCDIALVAEDGDVLLPAPAGLSPVQVFTRAAYIPAIKAAPHKINAPRAPPQRGPPTHTL